MLLQRGAVGGQGQAVVAVGGQEEDGPAVHLPRHLHVLLALHPHGPRLIPQPLDVVVDVVDPLAQLGKVVDLQETGIAVSTPGWPTTSSPTAGRPKGAVSASGPQVFALLGTKLRGDERQSLVALATAPLPSPLCGW